MITKTRSPRLVFDCATADDDAELRFLLRDIQMDGHIRMAFTREPNYFEAAQVEGDSVDVVVSRDTASGRIIGFGSRAEKRCYLNGQPGRIGYLSGLRCAEKYRRGTFLGRGFRFLKQQHQAGKVEFYLTSIVEDNHVARSVLTSGKAGLPTYKDFGRFYTLSIRPQKMVLMSRLTDLQVRRAQPNDASRIAEFLHRNGRMRQFFPAYKYRHFDEENGLLKKMLLSDVYLATRNGRLVGTLGLWDQKSFKQCRIVDYSPGLKTMRPLINTAARICRRPELPRPGSTLNYLTMALVCVEKDDCNIFEALFAQALCDARTVQNLHSVMVGLHEKDPFLPIAKRLPHLQYLSRIYLVFWPDGQAAASKLDGRTPYIELGAL